MCAQDLRDPRAIPPLPPPEDGFSSLHPPAKQQTRDEQLREIRRDLRAAREELAEVVPGRDYLRSPAGYENPACAAEGSRDRRLIPVVRTRA